MKKLKDFFLPLFYLILKTNLLKYYLYDVQNFFNKTLLYIFKRIFAFSFLIFFLYYFDIINILDYTYLKIHVVQKQHTIKRK